ncbi:unnamed protein product [Arctogadus glacialis]
MSKNQQHPPPTAPVQNPNPPTATSALGKGLATTANPNPRSCASVTGDSVAQRFAHQPRKSRATPWHFELLFSSLFSRCFWGPLRLVVGMPEGPEVCAERDYINS